MKIKILCIIILLLTFQPNINILSKGDTMNVEEIDIILSKQMVIEMNKLLEVMYMDLKNKGYIRDDITVPNADHIAQFYNFLGYYIMNVILTGDPPVPKIGQLAFQDSVVDSFPFANTPQEEIVKEIIANKKKDMITALLNSLNN